jgi:hypothetical protein
MTSKQRKTKQTRAEKKQTDMFRLRGIASAKAQRMSLQWSKGNKPPAYEKIKKTLNENIAAPELLNGDDKFVMRSLVNLYKFRLVLEERLNCAKERDGLDKQDQAAREVTDLDELILGIKSTKKKSASQNLAKRKCNFDNHNEEKEKKADVRAAKVKLRYKELCDNESTKRHSASQKRVQLAEEFKTSPSGIYNDLKR